MKKKIDLPPMAERRSPMPKSEAFARRQTMLNGSQKQAVAERFLVADGRSRKLGATLDPGGPPPVGVLLRRNNSPDFQAVALYRRVATIEGMEYEQPQPTPVPDEAPAGGNQHQGNRDWLDRLTQAPTVTPGSPPVYARRMAD